jgi:hypothetical protein
MYVLNAYNFYNFVCDKIEQEFDSVLKSDQKGLILITLTYTW